MNLMNFVVVSLMASSAFANAFLTKTGDMSYHTIDQVEVQDLSHMSDEELAERYSLDTDSVMLTTQNWTLDSTPIEGVKFFNATTNTSLELLKKGGSLVGSLNRMVRIGRMVYQIVEKNKPVVNASFQALSVLPDQANAWSEMEKLVSPNS